MYTNKHSAKLTLAVTYAFMELLVELMVFGWDILEWYYGAIMRESTVKTVMYTFYSCCPAAWIALVCIARLLTNILKEEIFTGSTVKLLRIIEWCCIFVTAVCLTAGFFYPVFWIFGFGSAFMSVILRVLKNVMATATQIKEENDLTV